GLLCCWIRTIAPGILPVATSFLKNSVTRASLSLLKCAPGGMSKLPSDEKTSWAATDEMANSINSAPNAGARKQFTENINPSPDQLLVVRFQHSHPFSAGSFCECWNQRTTRKY